jgi:hypothetical protein
MTAQVSAVLGLVALMLGVGIVLPLRQSLYVIDPAVRRRSRKWITITVVVLTPIVIYLFGRAAWMWINGL